jgi:hypothetical protein
MLDLSVLMPPNGRPPVNQFSNSNVKLPVQPALHWPVTLEPLELTVPAYLTAWLTPQVLS